MYIRNTHFIHTFPFQYRMAFYTLTFLVFGLYSFGQKDNDKINKIRNAVEQINNDSTYTIKKLDAEEFLEETTDNGGELSGYFKKGKLVKVVEWVGLSSCVIITEYYLQSDQLIFTYTQGRESPYIDSLQTFDNSKQTKTMECRFYFENHKVIKKIFKGSTRCGGAPTVEWAKENLEACSKYRKLFEKK